MKQRKKAVIENPSNMGLCKGQTLAQMPTLLIQVQKAPPQRKGPETGLFFIAFSLKKHFARSI